MTFVSRHNDTPLKHKSFKLLTRKLRGFKRTTNLWAFRRGFNSYTSWDQTWYIEWFHRYTSSNNHEIINGFDSTQKIIQLSMGVPSIHTAPRLLFLGVRTKTVATLFWNRTVKCPALYQIVLVKSPLCLICFCDLHDKSHYYIQYINIYSIFIYHI